MNISAIKTNISNEVSKENNRVLSLKEQRNAEVKSILAHIRTDLVPKMKEIVEVLSFAQSNSFSLCRYLDYKDHLQYQQNSKFRLPFLCDGYYHKFGLYGNEFSLLGWENGGACGENDIFFNLNTNTLCWGKKSKFFSYDDFDFTENDRDYNNPWSNTPYSEIRCFEEKLDRFYKEVEERFSNSK